MMAEAIQTYTFYLYKNTISMDTPLFITNAVALVHTYCRNSLMQLKLYITELT